jgi:hypothetical protein
MNATPDRDASGSNSDLRALPVTSGSIASSRVRVEVAALTDVGRVREANEDDVTDALVWAHHRVMPELFSMISTSCTYLCDDLKLGSTLRVNGSSGKSHQVMCAVESRGGNS